MIHKIHAPSSNESGHSSLTVMVIVLLLSALFTALTLTLRGYLGDVTEDTALLEEEAEMFQLAEEIIDKFAEDPTPESDGPTDPVWTYISGYDGTYEIELKDVSSKLNPNWFRTKLFEETDLNRLIISGEHPDIIRDRRESEGFVTDLGVWEETFGQENLERYFTLYGWANINVTYEASLEKIYVLRCGEGGSSSFRSRIQQGLKEGKLWTDSELDQVLGVGGKACYPVVNTLPQMNVHFIDPFLLECLLSYPYRETPFDNPQALAEILEAERRGSEITPERLKSILDPEPEQMRVLEYLGTKTTFWHLTVTSPITSLSWIIYWDGEALKSFLTGAPKSEPPADEATIPPLS